MFAVPAHNGPMFRFALIFLLSLALCSATQAANSAPPSEQFERRFDDLAALLNADELSPIETAQASLLASEIFAAGPPALPYCESRFLSARTQGESGLAGVFIVSVGGAAERVLIRHETESNAAKRKWIWSHISSEQIFLSSIQQGAQWQAAAALLPSAAKCRALAQLCMESRDLLTRRAGFYWGYWVADSAYWKKIADASRSEPDAASRRIAQRLLAMKSGSE